MKKLIFSELFLLFLATTFVTDSPPPGWYQQNIPIGNRLITDIYFLDSLKGWVVTNNPTGTDSSLILRTVDGGNNWSQQYKYYYNFNAVQFVDLNTGYAGSRQLFKTVNGGVNWFPSITAGYNFQDVFFINKDTGWICDANSSFGSGLLKTTNGGANWTQQLNNTYLPRKVFFINNDTGWVGTNDVNGRLFITTNSGLYWNLQYTSNFPVESLFFLSNLKGWLRGGTGNGVMYTTDGGYSWSNAQGNTAAGFDIRFVNDSIGFTGQGSFRIPKSTDGGKTWGYQNSPIQNNMSVYMFRNDTLKGWAGGTGIVRTDDGGGIIISNVQTISGKIPSAFKLYQNYPNPFNPNTKISYELSVTSYVTISLFDVTGKRVIDLVNQEQKGGKYEVEFSGNNLSSGVYFYSLYADGVLIDTKRMVLVK